MTNTTEKSTCKHPEVERRNGQMMVDDNWVNIWECRNCGDTGSWG